jgi:hypothetical protein
METQESAASTTRKGDRISISISVRVSCIDLAGEHFTDVVQTVNVSRSGCCLPLKCSLAPGQKIHLQRIGSGEEAVGRVVGQTGIRSEHNLYGIEVLNQSDNFWGIRFPRQWGIRFPREKELEESHSRALLKCAVCQTCHVTALNEVELSVFQITHRLTRMCDVCSANTVCEPVPDETSPEELLATGKKADKRKYGRISMKTVACVGPLGPEADLVDVVNISRGGICFHSSKTYHEDSWIQVAVPYTQGAANIFVAGCVVRSRKIGNDLTEYGVEYVKSED